MTRKETLNAYYYLTKPGIVRGNLITAAAGYLLASKQHIAIGRGAIMLLGLGLIIAAACVSNNVLDRKLDKKMARTAKRALVAGKISVPAALGYATVLLLAGSLLLGLFVNGLSLGLALLGYVAYVVVYGYYKRRSSLGTAVGSISGAIPPVVGYVAASNHIDLAAGLLFVILVCWQMPHFFAIAMFRLKDYAAAELPVLPVKKGLQVTKVQALLYIVSYAVSSLGLSYYGYTGKIYFVSLLVISLGWLGLAIRGFKATDEIAWAKQLFFFSLLALTVQSLLIGLNAVLI
ncbi:MAG: heme o synthase [Patescibacteria group bacterium]|nr:heme o synthase [Patescibacteria group bacterium]